MADLGCFLKGIVSVSVAREMDDETTAYILQHADVSVVVCSADTLDRFIRISPQCPKLHTLVVMDLCVPPGRDEFMSRANQPMASTVRLVPMSELLANGHQHPVAPLSHSEDDIATIIYTSGSTGRPKGVVLSYLKWNRTLSAKYSPTNPYVICSFQPLAHAGERTLYLTGPTLHLKIGEKGCVACVCSEMKIARRKEKERGKEGEREQEKKRKRLRKKNKNSKQGKKIRELEREKDRERTLEEQGLIDDQGKSLLTAWLLPHFLPNFHATLLWL